MSVARDANATRDEEVSDAAAADADDKNFRAFPAVRWSLDFLNPFFWISSYLKNSGLWIPIYAY